MSNKTNNQFQCEVKFESLIEIEKYWVSGCYESFDHYLLTVELYDKITGEGLANLKENGFQVVSLEPKLNPEGSYVEAIFKYTP